MVIDRVDCDGGNGRRHSDLGKETELDTDLRGSRICTQLVKYDIRFLLGSEIASTK